MNQFFEDGGDENQFPSIPDGEAPVGSIFPFGDAGDIVLRVNKIASSEWKHLCSFDSFLPIGRSILCK